MHKSGRNDTHTPGASRTGDVYLSDYIKRKISVSKFDVYKDAIIYNGKTREQTWLDAGISTGFVREVFIAGMRSNDGDME